MSFRDIVLIVSKHLKDIDDRKLNTFYYSLGERSRFSYIITTTLICYGLFIASILMHTSTVEFFHRNKYYVFPCVTFYVLFKTVFPWLSL